MSSYAELLKQRDDLEKQIESARQNEIRQAVSQIRDLVSRFSLTQQDVFPGGKIRQVKASGKVAPKYCDPATGATWTGRGKAPKWIEGKDRSQYVI
jgi:DNA-binding protein H-NS